MRCPVFGGTHHHGANQITVGGDIATLLGLGSGASVDDALLSMVLLLKDVCMVRVSVTVAGSAAKAGIMVSGITDIDGAPCFTGDDGIATGFTGGTPTVLSTPSYLDLATASKTVDTPRKTIVSVALALGTPTAGEMDWRASASGLRFSPYTTGVDVHVIDGGAWGGAGRPVGTFNDQEVGAYGGWGGNAGKQGYRLNLVPDSKTAYDVAVGAEGQSSSFMGVTGTMSAGGGGRGASAYCILDGGYGDIISAGSSPGGSNGVKLFGTGAVTGGGGGGGGGCWLEMSSNKHWSGGACGGGGPGGGAGAASKDAAEAGRFPGGGGGGGYTYNRAQHISEGYPGGAGAGGQVFCRWRT